jgi:hypothetical protein
MNMQQIVPGALTYLRHPKGVTCLKCGFLAFGNEEMITINRGCLSVGLAPFLTKASAATISQNAVSPDFEQMNANCFKSLWVREATLPGYGIFDEVVKRRRPCEGFFPYRPGYSPSEHRTLQEKKHDLNEKIRLGVLSALFGAAITILIDWLRKKYFG